MVDPKIVQGWIQKADEDFEYAKESLEKGLEFYAQICFHLQQAAEKYLKAYIIAKNIDLKKTHDLIQLLKGCTKQDEEFNNLRGSVIELNSYYIETRYPDFIGIANEPDSKKAMEAAEEIASLVKSKLSL